VARDLDAELTVLPGVGHFVPEEDPLGFTRAVVSLIGRAPSSSVPAEEPA
jgi:pimeloyl-ACP methyl ester carboxylesterase